MKHFILAATIIGALFFGVNLNTHAIAGQPVRDIPIECTQHINSSGDSSIGHCNTLHGALAQAVTTPCKYDEAVVNCYWNAKVRGDGKGHSFYSVRAGHYYCTIYWNKRYNARHGDC